LASVPYNFRENLEQWDLLSYRPSIKAATVKIQLPCNLLSHTLLPSIGTFGAFIGKNSVFDFAYYVANGLSALKNNATSSGTLQWGTPLGLVRKIGHYHEMTATCCMYTFGEALELGLIGSLIQQLIYGSSESVEMRNWLGSVISSLQERHPDSELLNEMLEGLELTSEDSSWAEDSSKPRAVVLVRTR
jgi:hypothetical protein